MTDQQMAERWVLAYRTAWESNRPDDIRALFTEDAEYRTAPFDEPWRGHDEIVEKWIAEADAPGQTTFTSRVVGIDGDLAFVEGDTDYLGERRYANLWVIALDDDGRARRFTEWYMRHPDA